MAWLPCGPASLLGCLDRSRVPPPHWGAVAIAAFGTNMVTPTHTELKAGSTLLGYRVLGLLASGGMAEVYLARRGDEAPVVLKRIRPNLLEDPQFVGMFMDEAKVAQSLNHANVVRVLEVGKDGREHALAMEFLDGRNLLRVARACYQRRAYVPYELMGRIMSDTLAGLDHAHSLKDDSGGPRNLVHRDMSPENIMITYGGLVKVVDFGIAKAADMESRTQAGVIKGKLGYVAPEAIVGEKLDARADIFAMGVTLYELLTYTVPFSGKNEMDVLTAITSKDPPRPSSINPSVPPELEDICLRALEKDRTTRWQTAAEMRRALEKFARATGKGASTAYLAAFMDALFPKAVDKERVRVAEMLGSTEAPPPAPPPETPDKPAGQRTGPAWSKALQVEAEMDASGGAPSFTSNNSGGSGRRKVAPVRDSGPRSGAPATTPPPRERTQPQARDDDQATRADALDDDLLAELAALPLHGNPDHETDAGGVLPEEATHVEIDRAAVAAELKHTPPARSLSGFQDAVRPHPPSNDAVTNPGAVVSLPARRASSPPATPTSAPLIPPASTFTPTPQLSAVRQPTPPPPAPPLDLDIPPPPPTPVPDLDIPPPLPTPVPDLDIPPPPMLLEVNPNDFEPPLPPPPSLSEEFALLAGNAEDEDMFAPSSSDAMAAPELELLVRKTQKPAEPVDPMDPPSLMVVKPDLDEPPQVIMQGPPSYDDVEDNGMGPVGAVVLGMVVAAMLVVGGASAAIRAGVWVPPPRVRVPAWLRPPASAAAAVAAPQPATPVDTLPAADTSASAAPAAGSLPDTATSQSSGGTSRATSADAP